MDFMDIQSLEIGQAYMRRAKSRQAPLPIVMDNHSSLDEVNYTALKSQGDSWGLEQLAQTAFSHLAKDCEEGRIWPSPTPQTNVFLWCFFNPSSILYALRAIVPNPLNTLDR